MIFRLTFGGPVGEEEENGLMGIFEQARKFQKEANMGVLADFMPWLRFALKGNVSKVCTIKILSTLALLSFDLSSLYERMPCIKRKVI